MQEEAIQIKTALISVFNKDGIASLAKFLAENKVTILSTGGTYTLLKENNINAIEISDYTGFPEMMSGRLKTLHPKIHGGLLSRTEDEGIRKEHEIIKIDLLIVNLYPFEETVLAGKGSEDIIEKIDIGGPSMIRSSAKNFQYTTVITDVADYDALQKELSENNFSINLEFRKSCASKAFALTAFYDAIISDWFIKNVSSNVQISSLSIPLRKCMDLRYGENPHQNASLYEIPLSSDSLIKAKQIQGKALSYNNICDADSAREITSSFEEPTVSIIKHANPCGIATGKTIEEAYINCLKCDSRSAFGGIVSLNQEVNAALAELIKNHFYEVIIAPKFSLDAVKILEKKPNLRLLECKNYSNSNRKIMKQVSGGMLVQDADLVKIHREDLECVSGDAQSVDLEEVLFAFKAVKFFKSNAIIITTNKMVVSFGCGQTSRIDAMEIACKKLASSGFKPSDCILASDAFFPFTDNLNIAAQFGIKTIVAPRGSIRDLEIQEFANKIGINLFFTKTRHFKH